MQTTESVLFSTSYFPIIYRLTHYPDGQTRMDRPRWTNPDGQTRMDGLRWTDPDSCASPSDSLITLLSYPMAVFCANLFGLFCSGSQHHICSDDTDM